ncbi:alpha-glucuronidase family glycosyl hydrolase [Nocardioides sp. NPDC057772]|uniref:alpha-glucuronidase family glycosyl hydrolase n=1 Tax=Nocardioides sp. NPDC057772 TaxID=3346245 RepID=UPI003672C878
MHVLPVRPARLLALLTALALALTMLAVASASPAKAASGPSPYPDDYDGSQMWLGYRPIDDQRLLAAYRPLASSIVVENATANPVHRHTDDLAIEPGGSEKLVTSSLEAARDELTRGLGRMLGTDIPVSEEVSPGAVVVGTPTSSQVVRSEIPSRDLDRLGSEGYLIRSVGGHTVIAGNTEVAALYGTYGFLRLMQTGRPISRLNDVEVPKVQDRWINNWDVERLYAGNADTAKGPNTGGLAGEDGSIFNFAATGASADKNLPVILDRYVTVARALASVGINGFNINNVNARNAYITPEYIEQEAALADALRPYGIKLALSIRYDAPTDQRFAPDTLTRDQLDPTKAPFRDWWTRRATMIQKAIPDFAGFTVKANSEGQPGPQDFGFDHGDGANGMAAAVEPLGMQIKWRTFVYNADVDEDRLKRAYLEFGPIDDEVQPDGSRGRIADNVFLQTKNGPLDFQAREPVNPMFGRMENTNQAIELQITQEYTGQSTMLAYLGPMWQEVFNADTGATDESGRLLPKRKVGHIVDGTAQGQERTAIVGVGNLGNADNLTGHHFSQSNLFAFGRMAWDWTLDSRGIAEDWTRMTWSGDGRTVNKIVAMMMGSWESVVSYQTPLGIGHQFGADIHYEPGPEETLARPDWSPTYYNKADSVGLGYDRSASGSGYSAQYFPTLTERFDDIETTPENLLMWFHHVPWGHEMNSGRPFWDELVYRYQMGVQYVTWMRRTWDSLEPSLDARRFGEVKAKLAQHEADAEMWRDECVSYWQTFSGREMPTDDGPTSIAVQIGGQRYDGFDLSLDEYTLDVPDGTSPRITAVVPADRRATYDIVEQAGSVPGRAVVEVETESFFGPLLKRYVLNLE